MEGTMGRRTVLLIAALVVAALGTTMVFLYVNGVNDRALAKQNPYKVLVAKKAIQPGTTLKQADDAASFDTKVISKDALVPGAVRAVTGLNGSVATSWIYPGAQIIQPMFGDSVTSTVLAVPPDKISMSLSLSDPAQVAGFVTPGASVAIFLTTTTAKNGLPQTRLLLPKVQVLAVGSQTGVPQDSNTTSGTDDSVSKSILTIAVDQKDYQKVLFATNYGKLNLGIPGKDFDATTSVPATDPSNLFN
jgi:pilus assembly protein CpaB